MPRGGSTGCLFIFPCSSPSSPTVGEGDSKTPNVLEFIEACFPRQYSFVYAPPPPSCPFRSRKLPAPSAPCLKKIFFGYVCEQLSYLSLFSFFFLVMFSFSLPYIPSKKYFNIKCPFFFFIASSTTGLSTLPSLPVEFSRQPNKRHHHRHHSSSCRAGDDTTHLS